MPATRRQTEAITTHDRSMVVTAGAGTGKTFVLVQKYIDLLETGRSTVPEILALTFTDKAAAEMKERIRKEIVSREGTFWEKAAEDFMIAPVQTFHSFCAQILREFPIEAGLEPGFTVLDQQHVARIHAKSFEELIHTPQIEPVNEAVVHVLSSSDQYALRTMLFDIYGKRLHFTMFFDALKEDEAQVLSAWIEEVQSFRNSEIDELLCDPSFSSVVRTLLDLAEKYAGIDDKAASFLCEIRPLLEHLFQPSSAQEFCRSATELMRKRPGNVGSKKNWNDNDLEIFRSARRDLNDILDRKASLFRMTIDPGDPLVSRSIDFLKELSRVFDRYRELVEAEKAAVGGLDFSDLILHARRLFLDQKELVETHFMPRFRSILVDEFQDTDPTQFDIILSIIGNPGPETDCLFVVGDPKQSIYLFRDADVTRFKEVQRIIQAECEGRIVNLDISFRSTGEVIGLTNVLFSRLFASSDKPWEFGYERIVTSESRQGHSGSVELLLAPDGADTATAKRNEADMVARKIHSTVHDTPMEVYEETDDHDFVRRPARFGDIAILLEQRTNLAYYLAALGTYGIPFYVHGGTGFYSRQEVYDLYNLLKFLERRHDDISLVGALRSPYFGLSDADIFFISQERGRTFWDKLINYSKKTGSTRASHACELLSDWMHYAGRVSLAMLIRRILADSGVYTVYSALPDGKQILANIEKIVAIARTREKAENAYTLADFTADLRTAMDEEEREGEAPLDTLAENAVNIMTVHAAKGLEFPIVFVPDMGMKFRDRFPPIMIGDNPLLVGVKVPDPRENYDPAETPVLAVLREMQRQKERAEKKRVLYVALTRARDHLVMSGTAPENPELSINLASSRIEWIFSALGISDNVIKAGELVIDSEDGDSPLRLAITCNPESIPAETGKVKPELIVVPSECAGKNGKWIPQVFEQHLDEDKVISVSELEEKIGITHRDRPSVQTKYLASIDGTTKGTIIHEVLRGRDPATVCREYGIDNPEYIRQCQEILDNFTKSNLMKRVKREFCELPFVASVEGIQVTGQIDRLCELDDGSWVVIDYKSEAVSQKDYSFSADKYAEQVDVYCGAAQKLLSGKPVTGWLYFIETGEFFEMINK